MLTKEEETLIDFLPRKVNNNQDIRQLLSTKQGFNMISQYLLAMEEKKDRILLLNELSSFCEQIHFYPDIDWYVELLNASSITYELLETVVEEDDFIKLDNTKTINSLLNVYYSMNYVDEFRANNRNRFTSSLTLYYHDIKSFHAIKREKEIELFKRKNMGDLNARRELIESNLHWVITIAKKYMGMGLDLQDLIQEGNLGLIKAVDTFDLNKKCRLSTYAFQTIRNAVIVALQNKSRLIRWPVNICEEYREYQNLKQKEEQKIGHTLTIGELGSMFDNFEKVALLENLPSEFMSIDTEVLINDEEELRLSDVIPSSSQSVEDTVIQNCFYDAMMNLGNKVNLTKRQQEVLQSYLLDGYTVAEVGQLKGVTRQAINDARKRVERKLMSHSKKIASYLDLEDKTSFTTSEKVKVKR